MSRIKIQAKARQKYRYMRLTTMLLTVIFFNSLGSITVRAEASVQTESVTIGVEDKLASFKIEGNHPMPAGNSSRVVIPGMELTFSDIARGYTDYSHGLMTFQLESVSDVSRYEPSKAEQVQSFKLGKVSVQHQEGTEKTSASEGKTVPRFPFKIFTEKVKDAKLTSLYDGSHFMEAFQVTGLSERTIFYDFCFRMRLTDGTEILKRKVRAKYSKPYQFSYDYNYVNAANRGISNISGSGQTAYTSLSLPELHDPRDTDRYAFLGWEIESQEQMDSVKTDLTSLSSQSPAVSGILPEEISETVLPGSLSTVESNLQFDPKTNLLPASLYHHIPGKISLLASNSNIATDSTM